MKPDFRRTMTSEVGENDGFALVFCVMSALLSDPLFLVTQICRRVDQRCHL